MLIRFRASNFRSLRDEVELSMVAGSFEEDAGSLVPCEALGCSLLRVAAIYGANAAGKSNVLAAMEFMSRAVLDSHRAWRPDGPIPRQPFLLDPERAREPSLFEVEFLLEGVRYRYGFRLDSQRILAEWLHAFPNRRSQLWFSRDADSWPVFTFGKRLRGKHRTIEPLTRKNSLFLSVAAENNHPALLPIYSWLTAHFALPGTAKREAFRDLSLALLQDQRHRSLLLRFLKDADLGIRDWVVSEREFDHRTVLEHMEQLRNEIRLGIPAPRDEDYWNQAPFTIELKHEASAGSEGVMLPFQEESLGTQAWFAVSGLSLAALDSGAVLTLDELDTSLHPHLALQVIQIFQDPRRNPKNAQLVFNTHDTNLLGSLRRDQIWFVEKDSAGATHLYPLTDFRPRKGENLERGYLQGRYGAVPFPGDLSFTADASSAE